VNRALAVSDAASGSVTATGNITVTVTAAGTGLPATGTDAMSMLTCCVRPITA